MHSWLFMEDADVICLIHEVVRPAMSDPAYEAMSKARRQADSGNPDGAVDTLEAYLATDPHNTKPRILLADIGVHNLKDKRYGILQLEIVLDLEPDNTEAMKALVTVLSEDKKNNKRTQEIYEHLLEVEPSAPLCNAYALFLRHQITDFKGAQKYYLKAIELDPQCYDYHLNYSVLLLNDIKDYVSAKKELEILRGMKPDDPLVNKNYSRLMREKFDKDGNLKRKGLSKFKR